MGSVGSLVIENVINSKDELGFFIIIIIINIPVLSLLRPIMFPNLFFLSVDILISFLESCQTVVFQCIHSDFISVAL
jgi:hypothetical protein